MSVVNVKVINIRPKYKNLEEWMKDENNVYIGRAGIVFINGKRYPSKSSIFANPYKIGKDGERNDVIIKYKKYILDKINTSIEYQEEFEKIKGKNLGCWCSPEKCHGDVLLELTNKYTVYDYFDEKCSICENICNEMSGWVCGFCKKAFCDSHNDKKYICKCDMEFIYE